MALALLTALAVMLTACFSAGGEIGANGSNLVYEIDPDASVLTVPDGVTEIADYAFMDAAILESVTLPEGLLRIGNCAFEYCVALKSIKIPASAEEIGASTFDVARRLRAQPSPSRAAGGELKPPRPRRLIPPQ